MIRATGTIVDCYDPHVVRRIFALADLHLSSSGDKPMDVFGEAWSGHAARMADSWDAAVTEDDAVLLPGDLSWARSLAEAHADIAWIAARPGLKVLLRGNHDSWWTSVGKVRRALPERCLALQNDAIDLGVAVVVGARGWTAPSEPLATPEDARVFAREIERLKLSLADARRHDPDLPRVAMVHYPPWIEGRDPTQVVDLLVEAGVARCVYGHLHGADHALGVVGVRRGVDFRLVAADAVGFAPVAVFP